MTTEILFGLAFGLGLGSLTYAYVTTIDKLLGQMKEQRDAANRLVAEAFLHVSSKNAKEAVEARALDEYEKEVLRQQKESFEAQKVVSSTVPESKEPVMLRDIHGNEFEVIGGEL